MGQWERHATRSMLGSLLLSALPLNLIQWLGQLLLWNLTKKPEGTKSVAWCLAALGLLVGGTNPPELSCPHPSLPYHHPASCKEPPWD